MFCYFQSNPEIKILKYNLPNVKRYLVTPNSSQRRLDAYIHSRNNVAEMGLSFKKSLCLKFHTKNIFKVDDTVNDPFSLINITNVLHSLRCPVAPFSPISVF